MWKRLSALWWLVRGDARALWFALRHPLAPTWLKVGTAMLVVYLFSPIDLVPDMIPVLGVVDDLVLIPAAIRLMLRRLPLALREQVERHAAGASGR